MITLACIAVFGQLNIQRCDILYDKSTVVGAPSGGVIDRAVVELGVHVEPGDVLASLRDAEERARVAVCRSEADAVGDVEAKTAAFKVADARKRTSMSLYRRGSSAAETAAIDSANADVAAAELKRAEENRALAGVRLGEAMARLRSRQVVAPHAGTVTEVFRRPGEGVQLGTPVLRIDDASRLKVVGSVDVAMIGRVTVGMGVSMHVDLPGVDLEIERQKFTGRVVFKDLKLDPETHMCKVVAIVNNPDGLSVAGLEGTMSINVSGGVANVGSKGE